MTRDALRWWAFGATVLGAAVAVAWALAHPQLPVAVASVRTVADIAGVLCLGLAAAPLLEEPRHQDELTRRGLPRLAVAGAVWLIAELIRLALVTAQAVSVRLTGLSLHTLVQFAVTTTPGRSALVGIAAAVAVTVLAVAPGRGSATWRGLTITAAAAGIAARAVTGHLSDSVTVGGLAVAVHALAAALWCGSLAALTLTVSARGQWARVLPAFSRLALWCVAVLLAGGVIAALVEIGSPSRLLTDGYGRILLAKILVTAVLVVLAWRNRTGWLVAARGHRITAEASRTRSSAELALMAVVLTLAAALSVTG